MARRKEVDGARWRQAQAALNGTAVPSGLKDAGRSLAGGTLTADATKKLRETVDADIETRSAVTARSRGPPAER